jgi:hypothetical protein
MRVLLNVTLDTAKTNQQIADGTIGKTLDGIMGKLQPEASYFYALNGARAMTLIVDAPDNASLPSLAEPFWLEFDANVVATPCMNADELGEGLTRLG